MNISSGSWVSVSELSKISKKPIRTIRNCISKGTIRVKKKGSIWLCDVNSIIEMAWIEEYHASNLPTTNTQVPLAEEPSLIRVENKSNNNNNSNYKSSYNKNSKKSNYRNLKSLGIYAELLKFYQSLASSQRMNTIQNSGAKKILNFDSHFIQLIYKTLQLIGVGFYEDNLEEKILKYSQARITFINALVFINIQDEPDFQTQIKKMEEALLPGIKGLIKKLRNRSNEYKKNHRATTSSKT